MLITFTSDVHADVVMFGDIATRLLRIMGASEQPPGILRGASIKLAADRLRAYLHELPQAAAPQDTAPADTNIQHEDETEELANRVNLRNRALPLLELMDAAYRKESDFIWR